MPDMPQFELSVSGRNDGTLEAAYIQLLDATVHKTVEIREGILLADYADDGRVVGIEILAPVKLCEVIELVKEDELRDIFRGFLTRSVSRELVTA